MKEKIKLKERIAAVWFSLSMLSLCIEIESEANFWVYILILANFLASAMFLIKLEKK